MTTRTYEVIRREDSRGVVKAWVHGVPLEDTARDQLLNVAGLPFVFRWVAAMPDVHAGMGATIGSVIATKEAVIPAAVGVDIGCGMMATRTSLHAADLPEQLGALRHGIERAVPHGRTNHGGRGDRGAWANPPDANAAAWAELEPAFEAICAKNPGIAKSNNRVHLGTLGTGNHFIEVCLDKQDRVWVMLHSGSRGVGGRIGNHFIRAAKRDMKRYYVDLPDPNLAFFPQGTQGFDDYLEAVQWAQRYAQVNRELMMQATLGALRHEVGAFEHGEPTVNCHHNYVAIENHFGQQVWVTRKGAVRARKDDLGIIPGSMGARSYIVRGLGNPESFHSCSHGAGRAMSRTAARKRFTVEQHAAATAGIECRKDADVIDETPMAYKDIDAVMEAQSDLVEVLHELRQVVCVKG